MNWTFIGAIASVVIPSILFICLFGHWKDLEFDCDLCGRHIKTRVWESGKVAACNVCSDCIENESQKERFYQEIDKRSGL